MNPELKVESVLLQIREKLNQDQVKLWLPPYYIEGIGCCLHEIEKIAQNYGKLLNIEIPTCKTALLQLQAHSVEKLRERDYYQETGIATLKVRVPDEQKQSSQISIAIKLTANGRELQNVVGSKIKEKPERVKLICSGRVLNENAELGAQGLKHGSQLMAIILHADPYELQNFDSHQKQIECTKADANLLAGKSNQSDDYYIQIEDQSGNSLKLPPEEQRALLVALSLHEKGRAALKKEDYSLALVLLLEADKQFSTCNSKLLLSVDNYAVLNLDVAWCYLCLRSVTHIPDAEQRLKKCEENFHRSYGPNLERLLALKGSTGNEAALFMRLHLLQAIVSFHQNKRQAAIELLNRAEKELQSLKVDDRSLCTLLELGYTASEGRISLRATHGDVNAAVEFINRRREEREEARRQREMERKINSERQKLGKCADGIQFVEPQLLNLLISMGFNKEIARSALRHTNNDVSRSVHVIQETPHLLSSSSSSKIDNEAVSKVVSVGFDPKMAKLALKKNHGDVEKAVEALLNSGGIDQENYTDGPVSDSSDSSDSESHLEHEEREKEEAYKRLSEGISTHEDDHLDLTLVQEEAFLREYKALLEASSSERNYCKNGMSGNKPLKTIISSLEEEGYSRLGTTFTT